MIKFLVSHYEKCHLFMEFRITTEFYDMARRMRTFSEEFGGQCPIRLDRRHLHEFSSLPSALGVPSHVRGLEDLQTSRLRGEHGSHW